MIILYCTSLVNGLRSPSMALEEPGFLATEKLCIVVNYLLSVIKKCS